MLRNRPDEARRQAIAKAQKGNDEGLAAAIRMLQFQFQFQFQFQDIRPKAASEITDPKDASRLLGHTEEELTERVYRRVGAIAKPSK
jgi:hypothetical protein